MLAQADWNGLILAAAGLLAVIVAGVIVLVVLRHRVQNLQQLASPEPFTLEVEQLRQLYSQGQLTELEFQRAKAKIIERMRGLTDSASPKDGGKTDPPGSGTSSS